MDRAKFFAGLRSALFGGKLTQGQVDGITAILDGWQASQMTDLRWLRCCFSALIWAPSCALRLPVADF